MPFGSADRELLRQVSTQLGQLTADLAALKQQVSGQQHAIDQTRQDTNAAITTGLAEIRAVAREGLARTNDIVTGPVASIGNELIAIRGTISQLDNQLRAAAAPAVPQTEPADENQPTPEPQPDPEPQPPAVVVREQPSDAEDLETLRAAAGISAAQLHMHRDTWAFLVEHTAGDRHFRIPGKVDDHDGAVDVHVSGPSIVAALTNLHHVSRTADAPGTRAIAGHIHARLVETVQEIVTSPHRGDGAQPVRIVIDDRAKPVDAE